MREFLAQSGLRAAARSAFSDLILGLCAAGLALTGVGFLLLTVYGALAREVGPIPAAGLIGLGLIFLASIALFVLRERRGWPSPPSQPAPVVDSESAVGDTAVMAIFVLGFVLSRHFLQRR